MPLPGSNYRAYEGDALIVLHQRHCRYLYSEARYERDAYGPELYAVHLQKEAAVCSERMRTMLGITDNA